MDRSLATLLTSIRASRNHLEAQRLLPSATGLLIQLSNALNVTLLASHILAADALFPVPTQLSDCGRVFSSFYTAARQITQSQDPKNEFLQRLTPNEWAKAVVKGADDRSPRWRHVLLLGGILLGLEGQEPHLSPHLRSKVELALVTATNLALEESSVQNQGASLSVVFVLNHTFALLSDQHRAQVQYARLLPLAIEGTLFSSQGLERGYWLGMVDSDVRETSGRQFTWSSTSNSFKRVQDIRSSPLLSSLGPLSRLIAHAVDNVQESRQVFEAVENIAEFGRSLNKSWRQNKLSEVDASEEKVYLDSETMGRTLPVLLQLLRDIFFTVIVVLRAAVGRCLCDAALAGDDTAPFLAMQCLDVLRQLQFITARFGQMSSSQYIFVNFTVLDILSRYPDHVHNLLQAMRPANLGHIPRHPLDRAYDLFFLNTAEHFTLVASSGSNENLILAAALPYVALEGAGATTELYEAAHSAILAVFASPQCSDLAARRLPFYIETLMQNFPFKLSSRQFRLATRSIGRLSAPPSTISRLQPLLQLTLLEILFDRAAHASESLLTLNVDADPLAALEPPSEKSTVVMALIDSLPFLPVSELSEWLAKTTEIVNKISDPSQRSACQRQFWDVLSNGQVDVEHSAACVAWWNSRGGREHLLYNEQIEEGAYLMSGAIQQEDSKL